MFKKFFLVITLILPISVFGNTPSDTTLMHSYVGVKTCGMCHRSEKQGDQLGIWQKSMHSKAYETLTTAKADSIAKAKGFSTPAIKTDDCLNCHVPAHNVPAKFKEAKYSDKDGVQCETCHGPGSDYKSLKVMKDEALAIKNGLVIHKTDTEEFCKSCHNSKSPTFVEFNFKESWDKIKHPIPSK